MTGPAPGAAGEDPAGEAPNGAPMSNGITFDPEAIRALAQILKDTDLTEIEVYGTPAP